MAGYFNQFIHYLSKFFKKEKVPPLKLKTEQRPTFRCETQLPLPCRVGSNNCRYADFKPRMQSSSQHDVLSQATKRSNPNLMSKRQVSNMSTMDCGGDAKISFNQEGVTRNRGVRNTSPLPCRVNNSSSSRYYDFKPRRHSSYPEDLSKIVRCPILLPLRRQSSSEMSLAKSGPEAKLRFSQEGFPKNRGENELNRLEDVNFMPEAATQRATRNSSFEDICQMQSGTSLGYYSTMGEPLAMTDNDLQYGCDVEMKPSMTKKQINLDNIRCFHCGFSKQCGPIESKIPVPVRVPRQENHRYLQGRTRPRARYPFTVRRQNSWDNYGENLGRIANVYVRSAVVSNSSTFRIDTSMKFERMFKSISKKKYVTGNHIDAFSHSLWMRNAGITVDKNSTMFKQFAGRRILLTLGEYKYLIERICVTHDLEYWDVMRKMATFHEEMHDGTHLLSQ